MQKNNDKPLPAAKSLAGWIYRFRARLFSLAKRDGRLDCTPDQGGGEARFQAERVNLDLAQSDAQEPGTPLASVHSINEPLSRSNQRLQDEINDAWREMWNVERVPGLSLAQAIRSVVSERDRAWQSIDQLAQEVSMAEPLGKKRAAQGRAARRQVRLTLVKKTK